MDHHAMDDLYEDPMVRGSQWGDFLDFWITDLDEAHQAYGANRPLDERVKDKAEGIKEDLKGGARRLEGEIRNDEGLKSEHDPSILERMGESIKEGAQYCGDKIAEGAEKLGLTRRDH